MTTFHHKPIKRFHLNGVIGDEAHTARLKTEYIRMIVAQMRSEGFVPRLDLNPDFTIDYNETKETFEFTLSIYGINVGKKNIEWILGIDEFKAIPIQKNKLSEYLLGQESPLNQK